MLRKPVMLAAGAVLVASAVTATTLAGAAAPDDRAKPPRPDGTIVAQRVAKVAPLDPASDFGHFTLLEGGAFGPDGRFYFVDLTAPAGGNKVMRFDPRTERTVTLYTDRTSAFSSLQFGPRDGRIYLTGYTAGTIVRMEPDGSDVRTVFSGPVAGRTMVADDIAFDPSGAMYVTDYAGTASEPVGRLVRLDRNARNPVVLHDKLVTPNGVSFTPDFSHLWVSELGIGQERLLELGDDRRSLTDDRIAMRANIGQAAFDSNTVDGAGNVYQAVPLAGRILVWDRFGSLRATVVIPQDLPKPQTVSTNLAIKPGTRQAYITVGGENGGYLYTFRSLAPGIAQSNGGSA